MVSHRIGKVYFGRGNVRCTNPDIPKDLSETDFLIIERDNVKMVKVDDDWNWKYGEQKEDPELRQVIDNFKKCIFVDPTGLCSIRIAE